MNHKIVIVALITTAAVSLTALRVVNRPALDCTRVPGVALSQECERVVDEDADRACIKRCELETVLSDAELDKLPARAVDCECE